MNVLIIEDEQLAAERLERLIKEHYPRYAIVDQIDTVRDSISTIQSTSSIDLIFCDIHLADGKCFEIFKEVKTKIPIIFTTAYDEYAIEAFDLNSVHYLLKPIDEDDLRKAISKFEDTKQDDHSIEKVLRQFIQEKPKRFLLKSGQRMIPKKESEIAFFFTQNKITQASDLSEGKMYFADYTLEQLETKILPKEVFFRINRKQIINKEAVSSIKPYKNQRLSLSLNIPSSQEFIVSREKVNSFKAWFTD